MTALIVQRSAETVRRRRWITAASALLLLLTGQPLLAAVIPVNALDSSLADDGLCSLREAVLAANADAALLGCAAGSGTDTIVLTGEVVLTTENHQLTALPTVTSSIVVRGNGYSISRLSGDPFRIFTVDANGRLTIKDTTIADAGGPDNMIGFTFAGGAIYSAGALRLSNSIFQSNYAEDGGAVYSAPGSTLDITGSTFVSNQSEGSGGALLIEGTAAIFDSAFAFNRAGAGGAFRNYGETHVERVLIWANLAGQGGGIDNNSFGGPALLSVTNTTISSNVASDSGPPLPDALPNLGGGMINSGTATLVHTTLYGNEVSGLDATGGGLYNSNTSSGANRITLAGSLIAASTGDNCYGFGTFSDGGNNLVDDTTCPGIPETTGLSSQLQAAPGGNGGPTLTHALLPGSDAIDHAGDCALTTDQRGSLRDSSCDAGAYEAGADDQYEISGLGGSDDSCHGHTIGFGRGERHLHTDDSSDWVRFQPFAGATYEIETSVLIGDSDTVLELWRDCAEPRLDVNDDGGDGLASKITYTAVADDELAGLDVLIRDFHGAGVNRGYDVTVTCTNGCPVCPLAGGDLFILRDETIITHREIEACGTIAAFDSVIRPGVKAVLAAGASIRLDDGFGVAPGAELVAEANPDLANLP